MNYQDKTLQCADCGQNFEFSISEQEFYASKGLTNHPKRCKPCRNERKNSNSYGAKKDFRPRKMYDVVCTQCGADAQVPFQPNGNKPVLCKDCYSKPSFSRRSA
ncbi:MAG: zinc-binding protein [Candidatus Melainabacteria bacterium GWF2_37_15]|nr:MAG: zinc-binding protein [Candidatus Melainabacteria bacterium GWF2_37_15]